MSTASPSIGIDFAEDRIRIARFGFDPYPHIQSVEEFFIPGYLAEDHMIFDPKPVSAALKKLCADLPFGTRCIFSVPDATSQFAWLKLSGTEPKELRDQALVRLTRGEEDPNHRTVAVLDKGQEEKLVVTTTSDVLIQRSTILEKIGFKIAGAEIQGQSILRSFAHASLLDQKLISNSSVTVAYVTESRTNVLVIQNGKLSFTRSSRIGYSGLLAKAAEILAIPPSEAAPILFSKSASISKDMSCKVVYDDRVFGLDVSQPMQSFVKEFKRVQQYFRSLHPERSFSGVIDRLVISGPPTLTSGFNSTLSYALSIRVDAHQPTWSIPIFGDDETSEELGNRYPSFAVPIGLGLAPYGLPYQPKKVDNSYVWNIRTA